MTDPEAWEIVVAASGRDEVEAYEAALTGIAQATSMFEDAPDAWRLTVWTDAAPDATEVQDLLHRAASEIRRSPPSAVIRPVAPKDWVAEVERTLEPVTVGTWFIHGSHVTAAPPHDAVAIRIDAGLAFGTGTHETTRGCLTAIERCMTPRRGRILDVGTGSGILAIAIARRYGVPVLASDNDPVAVEVARENAATNGVAHLIGTVVADGLDAPEIRRKAPFDLIVANIVANPLIALAPDLADALADGGRAILSGILEDQTGDIAAAYARAGLALLDTVPLGDWRTLVLGSADHGAGC